MAHELDVAKRRREAVLKVEMKALNTKSVSTRVDATRSSASLTMPMAN